MYCKQCGNEIIDKNVLKCPKCNTSVGKGGRFCEFCGKPKKNPKEECECQKQPVKNNNTWICQNCGSQNEGKFCVNCGTSKDYRKPKENLAPINPVASAPVETKREVGIAQVPQKITNPLYAKIAAQDDKKEISDIVKQQAVKMVYGAEAVKRIEAVDNTEEIVQPIENVQPVVEEVVPIKEPEVPAVNDVPEVKKIYEKPNIEYGRTTVLTPDKMPESHANNKADKLFPEAFSQQNLQVPPTQMPIINKSVEKGAAKGKTTEFFWVAALILGIYTILFAKTSIIGAVISTIAMLVFGILDAIFTKKKYGLGVIIGSIIALILILIF